MSAKFFLMFSRFGVLIKCDQGTPQERVGRNSISVGRNSRNSAKAILWQKDFLQFVSVSPTEENLFRQFESKDV